MISKKWTWCSPALVSIGVDAPGIGGHEMSNALLNASNTLGSQVLRNNTDFEFFSLAPPCMVCLGNIFSERPSRLACAITHERLRAEVALPDTPFPSADWIQQLTTRGIRVDSAIAKEDWMAAL